MAFPEDTGDSLDDPAKASESGTNEDDAPGKDRDRDKNGQQGGDGKPPETSEQKQKTKRILIIAALVAGVLLVIWGAYYLIFLRGRIDTDDAYIDGRAVAISAKVGGYVQNLAVTDNQLLKAGDLILAIDPRDYQVALQNADASLSSYEAQLASARVDREIKVTSTTSDYESAKAQRAAASANLAKSLQDLRRQRNVDPQATTQQQTDTASAQAAEQEAQLREAEAQLKTASLVPENIAVADAKVAQLEAQVEVAKAQVAQARLNLGYAEIRAPQEGRVTRRNVELGTYVQPGQTVMSLVSPQVWVTANYKENQLQDMRAGQPVVITVDAYPSLELHGHVDSIQMGSGSRFSAFPAENATGNFVKIVQRMPVKILIDRGLDPKIPLPLGASVIPTVDVR